MINYEYDAIKSKIACRVPPEMDFPEVLLIDTVSYCNLKCSMCPHKDMQRKPGYMSLELYMKVIDEIAANRPDAQIWITFFGEGALHRDLPGMILYARKHGLTNIILNSNGNLITPAFGERLIRCGLNGLYVGIDATTEENYQKARVGGNLETVKQNVLAYKRMLDEFGKDDQRLVVQFVEMEYNRHEVDDFVAFWHGTHGITCKIRPMVSWANRVEANNLKDDLERIPCYWAMNTINITDTGMVALCSVDLECREPRGNVNEKSIKEIWQTTLRDFRKLHRDGLWDELPKMCRECKDWQSGYAEYK